MNRPSFITVVVFGVVLIIGAITFQEVAQVFTAAETWCQSYNGTLVMNETMRCELPNGTVRDVPQNLVIG